MGRKRLLAILGFFCLLACCFFLVRAFMDIYSAICILFDAGGFKYALIFILLLIPVTVSFLFILYRFFFRRK